MEAEGICAPLSLSAKFEGYVFMIIDMLWSFTVDMFDMYLGCCEKCLVCSRGVHSEWMCAACSLSVSGIQNSRQPKQHFWATLAVPSHTWSKRAYNASLEVQSIQLLRHIYFKGSAGAGCGWSDSDITNHCLLSSSNGLYLFTFRCISALFLKLLVLLKPYVVSAVAGFP